MNLPVHSDTQAGNPAAVAALVRYFEALSPASLAQLGDYYAPDARFKDPFNDVTGVAAIRRIFEHMFDKLEAPRFVVTAQVQQGPQCFLTWDFFFGFKSYQPGVVQCICGATHLVLSDAGLVTLHRDYWDAAEELYEKLPLVGGALRWLKRRLA
ncbi:MAG: isomerase [Comamonadaceae bacterium CG1_02_60_18]|nr:MAG: isomerase [Comamonadaceae bacterium CG1_02_60_18]PIQ52989.1 MAG: isomerase [Comamonadaceae bacterium CG12_big_fil_rev_8_21_14_0_65_59_15]